MARKQTKAQQILIEARNRVTAAESAVNEARQKFEIAGAALKAHRDIYQTLEEALAPKPRVAPKPKKPAKTDPASELIKSIREDFDSDDIKKRSGGQKLDMLTGG